MQIRPITVNDIDHFISLWNRVYEEGEYLRSPAPDKTMLSEVITRVEKESIPQFVAFDGKRLVGSIEIFPAEMCATKEESSLKRAFSAFILTATIETKG